MLRSVKVAFSQRIFLKRNKNLWTRLPYSSEAHISEGEPNEQEHPAIKTDEQEVKSKVESKHDDQDPDKGHADFKSLANYRFAFPEFLPVPTYDTRNKILEKLERADMLKRRIHINIPEFYAGSILAVVTSDPYAPGKENRFVGRCILRTYGGLRATFTLRNIVDNEGIEIMYNLYNPTIQSIQVLRLEKWLDDDLLHLRDCDPKYSTIPFDMDPEYLPEGEPVPVFTTKLKLNPRPWNRKWHLYPPKGVLPFDEHLNKRHRKKVERNKKPPEEYDLMKEYRKCIPEEDQQEIWEEVDLYRKQFLASKQQWKQRILQKAPKKSSDREQ